MKTVLYAYKREMVMDTKLQWIITFTLMPYADQYQGCIPNAPLTRY